eukprot:TRINITY_DN7293_c0_g2_i1.p1 TRINITY_DN7293_c0_g2~~TRINITY_DN7293_c0_g2_i1.p1  ORF type:complete len:585 (+),score=138.30 TRINITY_DN7293_c0_g2_i1:13-1767(+)
MASDPQEVDECCICLEPMIRGKGKALIIAECGHTLHLLCVQENVRISRSQLCPLCRAPVTSETRIQAQQPPAPENESAAVGYAPPEEAVRYQDDDFLPVDATAPAPLPQSGAPILSMTFMPESTVVTRSETVIDTVVTLQAAPRDQSQPRYGADVVALVECSTNTVDPEYISSLRDSLQFLISALSPSDRLSIIQFSDTAIRLSPLLRMNDNGKRKSKAATQFLRTGGPADLSVGLLAAAKVLNERRFKNAVCSLFLVTAGVTAHIERVLPSIESLPETCSIHSFALGPDHDSALVGSVSERGRGVFHFCRTRDHLIRSFGSALAGVSSVVAQNVSVELHTRVGARVVSVSSEFARIHENGAFTLINLIEIFAEEKKVFLVKIMLPQVDPAQADDDVDTLYARCRCDFTLPGMHQTSSNTLHASSASLTLTRPLTLPATAKKNLSVFEQRVRVEMVEALRQAALLTEIEQPDKAVKELRSTLAKMESERTTAGLPDSALCSELTTEVTGLITIHFSPEQLQQLPSQRKLRRAAAASLRALAHAHMAQRSNSNSRTPISPLYRTESLMLMHTASQGFIQTGEAAS